MKRVPPCRSYILVSLDLGDHNAHSLDARAYHNYWHMSRLLSIPRISTSLVPAAALTRIIERLCALWDRSAVCKTIFAQLQAHISHATVY